MIARSFVPTEQKAGIFPDIDFRRIYAGMRTLDPACDIVAMAVAANNIRHIQVIEEAVIELVKDSCWMLNNTKNDGGMIVPNSTIQYVLAVLHSLLLPPGTSN